MITEDLDKLFSDILSQQDQSCQSLPPVHRWNPELSGDMDLVIDREGRWFHEGGEIKRAPLVKLFASILKYEEGEHFLVSPVEKWRIKIDVAPFFVISVDINTRHGEQAITCITSTGDNVVIGKDHPLWVDHNTTTDEPVPMVMIRDGLTGLLSRNAYYQIVESAEARHTGQGEQLFVSSMGQQFLLGDAV
ncbi:DUF1285 domain-containing protein [Gammaproteobacteria bacterium]|nr:DUF1285 domain-containing protein [Gammaproteobacteria bacterium]|tara:strand:+ start:1568 stop:2140 length:573 start_codon:yes stop_codon:yes gene_type:complete